MNKKGSIITGFIKKIASNVAASAFLEQCSKFVWNRRWTQSIYVLKNTGTFFWCICDKHWTNFIYLSISSLNLDQTLFFIWGIAANHSSLSTLGQIWLLIHGTNKNLLTYSKGLTVSMDNATTLSNYFAFPIKFFILTGGIDLLKINIGNTGTICENLFNVNNKDLVFSLLNLNK